MLNTDTYRQLLRLLTRQDEATPLPILATIFITPSKDNYDLTFFSNKPH